MKIFGTTLLLTALPLVLAASNPYCRGIFEANTDNCSKFAFKKDARDSESCDSGNPLEIKVTNCTTFYNISGLPEGSIDDHTAKMAQLITNVFENGDTRIGYAYVERLGDCRGYTSGYIGFTTGTNDAYTVVQEYVKRKPKAKLGKFLKELKRLSGYPFGDPRRDDTSHLKGYPKAWQSAACGDATFVQTQLDVGHSMYLQPAMKYAASVGVESNLGKAIFYDTIIQHGWQYTEPDINLPRILHLTGRRQANETEKSYLTRFLTTRRQLVCCYPGDVWNESSDRMADLQNLVNDWEKNKDLTGSVNLEIYGETVTGKENMLWDSQNCKKAPKGKAISKEVTLQTTCSKR